MKQPKVGIFFTSLLDAIIHDFMRDITNQTKYSNYKIYVGISHKKDENPEDKSRRQIMARYLEDIYDNFIPLDNENYSHRGMGMAADYLNHIYKYMIDDGCKAFFYCNDDVSFTRYWLTYLIKSLDQFPDHVLVPYDGIHSESSILTNFFLFTKDYVENFCPNQLPFYNEPYCFYVDTEFMLRAYYNKLIGFHPLSCVLHLHWTVHPRTDKHKDRQDSINSLIRDTPRFIEHMKKEGINPLKILPGFSIENETIMSMVNKAFSPETSSE